MRQATYGDARRVMRQIACLVLARDGTRYTGVARRQFEALNTQVFASGFPDDAACPLWPAVCLQLGLARMSA